MTIETCELRWFFRAPPPALDEWDGESATRTDWYAPLAQSTSSVKFREGYLETKTLRPPRGRRPSHQELVPEQWTKISLELDARAADELARNVRRHWIAVGKQRTLRCYAPDGRRVAPSEVDPQQVVEVEFCKVTVRDTPWWTFCLEAPQSLGPRAVQTCWQRLATAGIDFDGNEAVVQSYPAWLLSHWISAASSGV